MLVPDDGSVTQMQVDVLIARMRKLFLNTSYRTANPKFKKLRNLYAAMETSVTSESFATVEQEVTKLGG